MMVEDSEFMDNKMSLWAQIKRTSISFTSQYLTQNQVLLQNSPLQMVRVFHRKQSLQVQLRHTSNKVWKNRETTSLLTRMLTYLHHRLVW